MYTWQMLSTLEVEEVNFVVSRVYRYYRKASILIVPITSLGLYVSISILSAKFEQLQEN